MSSEKKFRIQNGLDVAGEVFVNGINIVGADGVLNEASYQTAVQAMIDATVAQGVDQGSIDTAVSTAVAALADSAPATLDTLNELAAALGDDADFATSMTNALNTKLTAANNLSDVADAAAARSNLGLGTAATAATTSFATAAQGAKADAAATASDLTALEAQISSGVATLAQGALADTAVQPEDFGNSISKITSTTVDVSSYTPYDVAGTFDWIEGSKGGGFSSDKVAILDFYNNGDFDTMYLYNRSDGSSAGQWAGSGSSMSPAFSGMNGNTFKSRFKVSDDGFFIVGNPGNGGNIWYGRLDDTWLNSSSGASGLGTTVAISDNVLAWKAMDTSDNNKPNNGRISVQPRSAGTHQTNSANNYNIDGGSSNEYIGMYMEAAGTYLVYSSGSPVSKYVVVSAADGSAVSEISNPGASNWGYGMNTDGTNVVVLSNDNVYVYTMAGSLVTSFAHNLGGLPDGVDVNDDAVLVTDDSTINQFSISSGTLTGTKTLSGHNEMTQVVLDGTDLLVTTDLGVNYGYLSGSTSTSYEVDDSLFATKAYVDSGVAGVDLSGYSTTAEMNTAISNVSVDLSGYSTTAEMNTAITSEVANVVDAAPAALDTLNELAAALGDDENFASTMTTALAGKATTSDLQTLQDSLGISTKLYVQDSAPSTMTENEIWINSTDGTVHKSGASIQAGGITSDMFEKRPTHQAAWYGDVGIAPTVLFMDEYTQHNNGNNPYIQQAAGGAQGKFPIFHFQFSGFGSIHDQPNSWNDNDADVYKFKTPVMIDGFDQSYIANLHSVKYEDGTVEYFGQGVDVSSGGFTKKISAFRLGKGSGNNNGTIQRFEISQASNSEWTQVSSVDTDLSPYSTTAEMNSAIATAVANADVDLSGYSTTAEMNTAITSEVANVVDAAPAALDTLNELAAALGDDANFASTMTTALADKASQVDLDAETARATSAETINNQAIAILQNQVSGISTSSGSTDIKMTAEVNMDSNNIKNANDVYAARGFIDTIESDDLKVQTGTADFEGSTVNFGSATITGSGFSTASNNAVDNHINVSTANAGEFVKWTGTDYEWTDLVSGRLATDQLQVGDGGSISALLPSSTLDWQDGLVHFGGSEVIIDETPTSANHAANKSYVDGVVAATVDAAPAALDTLNELAAALGDDANFASTVTTSIAAKADTTYVDTQIAGVTVDTSGLATSAQGALADTAVQPSQLTTALAAKADASSVSSIEDFLNGNAGDGAPTVESTITNPTGNTNWGDEFIVHDDVVLVRQDSNLYLYSPNDLVNHIGNFGMSRQHNFAYDPVTKILATGHHNAGGNNSGYVNFYHLSEVISGTGDYKLSQFVSIDTGATRDPNLGHSIAFADGKFYASKFSNDYGATPAVYVWNASDIDAQSSSITVGNPVTVVAPTIISAPSAADPRGYWGREIAAAGNYLYVEDWFYSQVDTNAGAIFIFNTSDNQLVTTLECSNDVKYFVEATQNYYAVHYHGVNPTKTRVYQAGTNTLVAELSSVNQREHNLYEFGNNLAIGWKEYPYDANGNYIGGDEGVAIYDTSDFSKEPTYITTGSENYTVSSAQKLYAHTGGDVQVYDVSSLGGFSLQEDLEALITANTSAISVNTSAISANTSAISAETTARTSAISAETTARESAVTSAISTASSDATTKADAAEADAIATASADATSKANAAQSAAVSTASSDATAKANAAQSAAEATASADATTKADAAQAAAAADATTKADAALASAQTYADNAASTAVGNVIDAAPASLDTLNELAAALGDDANFASTVTASLATKANTADVATAAQGVKADSALQPGDASGLTVDNSDKLDGQQSSHFRIDIYDINGNIVN